MLVGVVVGTDTDARICVEASAWKMPAQSQHRNIGSQPSDENGLAINSLQVEGTGTT